LLARFRRVLARSTERRKCGRVFLFKILFKTKKRSPRVRPSLLSFCLNHPRPCCTRQEGNCSCPPIVVWGPTGFVGVKMRSSLGGEIAVILRHTNRPSQLIKAKSAAASIGKMPGCFRGLMACLENSCSSHLRRGKTLKREDAIVLHSSPENYGDLWTQGHIS
jgi:hypothetical protein